jgi:hypothetical protein
MVGRVSLAGEKEEDGPVGVADDAAQDFRVVEEQRGALVGGEAPGKTDGEHIGPARVGELEQPIQVGR